MASRTLAEPLAWQNSTVLQDDLAEAVAALKQETASDLRFLWTFGDRWGSLMSVRDRCGMDPVRPRLTYLSA